RPGAAAACGALWLAGTAEFALARVRPGPRTRDEVVTMALTSVAIPPTAVWHWLRGQVVHRGTTPFTPSGTAGPPQGQREPEPEQVGS
ncbi:transferase, partial [Streptomyces sp. NPDC052676]